ANSATDVIVVACALNEPQSRRDRPSHCRLEKVLTPSVRRTWGSVHPRSNLRRPKGKPIGQVIEPLFCPRGEFLRTHCRWSSRLNKHRLQLPPTTALSGIGGQETNLRSRLKPKRARHAEQSQPKGYLPETRRSM